MRVDVETGQITHANNEALNVAVDAATWRKVGERGRAFARKSGDIAMLEAVAVALHAAKSANYDLLDSIA